MSNKKKKAITNRDYRFESPLESLDYIIHTGELILEKLLELQELYKENNYPNKDEDELLTAIAYAKQQYVITMVSGMEHFFKDLLIDLIDEELIDPSKLSANFELEDVVKLRNGDLNLGEAIAKNYNFQNLDEINKVYSRILNVNFYDKLKEVIKTPEYKRDITYLVLDEDFYPLINEVIELRHKNIHDLDLSFEIDLKKLEEYSHQINSLGLATGWLLDECLGIRLVNL